MRETVRRVRRVLVPALLVLGALLAPAAVAEPLLAATTFSFAPVSEQSPSLENGWWRDHFAFRLRGIEYREDFRFRRQSLRLHLSGPVVRGSPWMRLELRGWVWGETEASFSAYGSPGRQGFKLRVDF